ncbi:MAG: RagB/SusD family nutrient uptake outer membrane protein [Bacteroidales bacterium]|nr:RagB/SusD family nutrient uptake outer membrane protein [Bacteroidales bacterium]
MKLNRLIPVIAGLLAVAACNDFTDIKPESGTMLSSQVKETNAAVPTRAKAAFDGMITNIGKPIKMYSNPDDWEFLMMMFCNDLEGADALIADSGYNWFSVCGEYSSRNANYRNPYIRYRTPYNMVADANTFLSGFGDDVTDQESIYMIAQAHALRAYSYLMLVPAFQFVTKKDAPSVPKITLEEVDYANNPRASVQDMYDLIIEDLTYAIDHLDGYSRPTKAYIDKSVALGLRARANLDMQNYQAAYDDAVAAAAGYTPKSIGELKTALFDGTAFEDISEHDWIWGYDMNTSLAATYRYATTSSWLRSFSGWAYAPACQVYTCINKMLWEKIPDTDIRKQWWVDENLQSSLIVGLKWKDADGNLHDDVANYSDGGDSKLPFLPYTNVKFGCNPIGTVDNSEDMPMMRVDEMILIQAECLAKLGKGTEAANVLTNYVQTYRDPDYSVTGRGLTLENEIWFQRRVELWGEGFGVFDIKRLAKPLVRFKDNGKSSNIADAFRFNMAADDGWLLMRFPQGELDTNFGIEDNTEGSMPKMDQNPGLRDGVTD